MATVFRIWLMRSVLATLYKLVIGLMASVALAAEQMPIEMRFKVSLDDKPIGYHTFTIRREGQTEVVDIKAEFDVSVLFIPVYSYRHQNTEVWRDGCLMRIDSRTDDNGEYYRVNGERRNETFDLVAGDQARTLPAGCIMTFAYWNPEFLAQSHLLNAQNGEYIEVKIERLETESIQLNNGEVPVEGFRVRSADRELDIRVWYMRDSRRWLALESTVENGRTLRYVPAATEGLASAL